MTPEPLQNLQQMEQDYKAVLAALRDEKNQQISEYKNDRMIFAQRANEAEKRAEHFKADRDALQERIDGALARLRLEYNDRIFSEHYILGLKTKDIKKATEILSGEGE